MVKKELEWNNRIPVGANLIKTSPLTIDLLIWQQTGTTILQYKIS